MNSLIWICSPCGRVVRTYHPGSAFIWTGSNFVFCLEPSILSLWGASANLAREKFGRHIQAGARAAGATVDVKRVPETVPEAIAKASHFKLDQPAPIATPGELPNYDAIIVGAPTRFGRMPSSMGSFWEQAGAEAPCMGR